MNLYIDCEWNDYKGDLISMALISSAGHEFYEVLYCDDPSSWVAKNVLPVLNKDCVGESEFKKKLSKFLMQFDAPVIIADWPEDIAMICDALIVAPGVSIEHPDIYFRIVRGIGSEGSEIPHNALADARAIMAMDVIV